MTSFPIRKAGCYLPIAACTLCVVLCGCPQPSSPSAPPTAASVPGNVKITVTVVGDQEMAGSIARRRGEWEERNGSHLEVQEMTPGELTRTEALQGDVIIYPVHSMGALVERNWIIPVRKQLIESEEYNLGDIFSLLHGRVATWGERVMAAPLGVPCLVLYYRTDIFEALDRRPPETWKQYEMLVDFFRQSKNLGDFAPPSGSAWHATLEPWSEAWGGRLLLARAAAYIQHPNRISDLFESETMEPLIATAPFVRALTEMRTAAGDADHRESDPHSVRREFMAGHAPMALSWPSAAADLRGKVAAAFAELPGAAEVFNPNASSWEPREASDRHVSVLGVSGRLVSVTEACRNVPTAFQFVEWIASGDVSRQVCAASLDTTLFRQSHRARPEVWVEPAVHTSAQQYADIVVRTQTRSRCLIVPRIHAADRYLAALNQAVKYALEGSQTPKAALQQAASRWQAITQEVGVEKQHTAYRRSLGLR